MRGIAMYVGTLILACAVLPAMADYWVQYQPRPDAPYPEDQGWERITAYGGAERSIQDGALVLDSSASGGIVDTYTIHAPGTVHAEPNHPFELEWRVKVDYSTGVTEAGVGIFSDDEWTAGFWITSDRIYSASDYPTHVSFVPGWHTFRVVTDDMRSWALSIDATPVLEGSFVPSYWALDVNWGDGGQGGTSLTRWAYCGYGMVPEPAGGSGLCLLLNLILRVERRGLEVDHV